MALCSPPNVPVESHYYSSILNSYEIVNYSDSALVRLLPDLQPSWLSILRGFDYSKNYLPLVDNFLGVESCCLEEFDHLSLTGFVYTLAFDYSQAKDGPSCLVS